MFLIFSASALALVSNLSRLLYVRSSIFILKLVAMCRIDVVLPLPATESTTTLLVFKSCSILSCSSEALGRCGFISDRKR